MTNRFSYAISVLRNGIPEPELAYIPGEAQAVTLFCVGLHDWKFYPEIGMRKVNQRWHFFSSCAHAHSQFPNESVEAVKALKASGRYFFHKWLREIEIEPKPKRAKGKAIG